MDKKGDESMNAKDRAERFKQAREKYNQHGKQSLRIVDHETGISKSTIQKLESSKEDNDTNVGYIHIVTLADYYGVNVAWLMGQPGSSPSLDVNSQTVTQVTGLSSEAISILQDIKNTELIDALNKTIENKGLVLMIQQFTLARQINEKSTQTEKQAEAIERLQDFGIANGMESTKSRMSDRQLIDMYLWRASHIIENSFEQILKGDKDNG